MQDDKNNLRDLARSSTTDTKNDSTLIDIAQQIPRPPTIDIDNSDIHHVCYITIEKGNVWNHV